MKQNDISISYPLFDNQSNYMQTFKAPEGERFGVLFTFTPGEKLHIISEETNFRIGQFMAQMHNITDNQRVDRIDYSP